MIDLSSTSFGSEPTDAGDPFAGLSQSELADVLESMEEVGLLGSDDDDGELSDAELQDLLAEVDAEATFTDAAEDFDQAFAARAAADASREQMRAELGMLDTVRPAVQAEDKMSRALFRAANGLYDTDTAMSFAAESAAVELAVSTGAGICGNPDEWGRCGARYHALSV